MSSNIIRYANRSMVVDGDMEEIPNFQPPANPLKWVENYSRYLPAIQKL